MYLFHGSWYLSMEDLVLRAPLFDLPKPPSGAVK